MSELPTLMLFVGLAGYLLYLSPVRAFTTRVVDAVRQRVQRREEVETDEEPSTTEQPPTRIRREDDPEITRFDTSVLDRFRVNTTNEKIES